jgi:hypothetical protein
MKYKIITTIYILILTSGCDIQTPVEPVPTPIKHYEYKVDRYNFEYVLPFKNRSLK